jgi:copper oxidase (laccase) domain-containing protein
VITDHDDHWVWTVDGARAVFTSRELGNIGLHVGDDPAVVLEHRRRAAALAGLGIERVAGVTQVHGSDVWLDLARGDTLPAAVRWDGGPSPIDADALVSTRPGIALAIGVADCLPIAISWGSAITAIHAGWRSLDAGVIEQTFAVLRRQAGSAASTHVSYAEQRGRHDLFSMLEPMRQAGSRAADASSSTCMSARDAIHGCSRIVATRGSAVAKRC